METLSARRALLSFYRKRGRDLPWRRTRDPYAIWISEIMLQQTRVETARARFADFLRQFPDVSTLAGVDERRVCEAWAGLGYYRRARNLHKAARVLVERFGGQLPQDLAALRGLPGIGAYTAAAIAAIAFGIPAAAVDGNLVRVLARVFALPGRASDPGLVRAVRARAEQLVDGPYPGEINQALMDVGAVVCKPETPDCRACPLRPGCQAFRAGTPAAYPGKSVRLARSSLRVAFAWIERAGALLLEQRPLDGLWPGLWELPSASGHGAKAALAKRLDLRLGTHLALVTHELTHRHVEATVYRARSATPAQLPSLRWWRAPLSAPLSALARKAILAARRQAGP